MANDDWNLDDYLNFNYDSDHGTTDTDNEFEVFDRLAESNRQEGIVRKGLDDSFDSYEEFRRYEEVRNQEPPRAQETPRPVEPARGQEPSHRQESSHRQEPVRRYDPARRAEHVDRSEAILPPDHFRKDNPPVDDFVFDRLEETPVHRAPVEVPEEKKHHNARELEAIKQASQEAYDRYRSNYVKNRVKRAGRLSLSKPQKILMGCYGVSLAAFAVSMGVMNVLPAGLLITLYVVLALLSAVIIAQIRRANIKTWGRRLATLLAVVLVFVYSMGTAYAMGTLSFLSTTSVDNEKSVMNITKDPFNVVITGMDVDGKIDTQGRSDVNMVLTVNPKTAQILMTSIPRDYEIRMPDKDYATDKLTHTGFYSVETTILAEEDLLELQANYYVKVNFSTVEKFIDAIGGIDVYSEYEFTPVKMKDWTVQEGMNHMNGKQALAFARERKAFPSGDNQRIKNQQAVFEAMLKKGMSSRTMLLSYNKILTNLTDYFEMSFSSKELRALVKKQIAKDPNWLIYKNTIIGGNGSKTTYTTGDAYCYVMTRDEDSIANAKALIQAVMNGTQLEEDENGNVHVVQTEETEGEGSQE